ncbi:MAG: DUF5652 family protein [Candidatus Paceibacterota bacterium]
METLNQNTVLFILILVLWILPWKGYALWTAARNSHKGWFIALIVLNTLAILDIFYIFYIAKRTPRNFFKAFKTKL